MIFQFEDWKHDFLGIFGQHAVFSALQPKSLKNPLRRQYRGILVKLSQLQSIVGTRELQKPLQMCISTERESLGALYSAMMVFVMSTQKE